MYLRKCFFGISILELIFYIFFLLKIFKKECICVSCNGIIKTINRDVYFEKKCRLFWKFYKEIKSNLVQAN